MSTQRGSAAEVAEAITRIARAEGRALTGRGLQALAYLAHASAMADGAGMLIRERAQIGRTGEGPVFAGLDRAQADALARATGTAPAPAHRGLEARVRALAANDESVLIAVWQDCGEREWDETRLGTVSDGVVASDGARMKSALRRCAARAGVAAFHTAGGVVVQCRKEAPAQVRVCPRRGRDVVFAGVMRGQAERRYERLTLYETEGGTCVMVRDVSWGGGGWRTHEVRTARPGTDAGACAQLAQGPLARALLESAGPQGLFGQVLERDTTSKIVWREGVGRYIGGQVVHSAEVDTRRATMYKANDGRIAVVSTSNTETSPRVDVYDDEEEMVSHCGTQSWLRDLCRQAGIDTAVHIE